MTNEYTSNFDNRYRVEVTIPVWYYMTPETAGQLPISTQEDIIGTLIDDLESGAIGFMDVRHWRVIQDNPTITIEEFMHDDVESQMTLKREREMLDIDKPIDYYPTGSDKWTN